jgi:hypothetical protein
VAAPGEVHEVGEQHRDLGEPVGDDLLAPLEPVGDRAREDVAQQLLGALPLGLEQAVRPVKGATVRIASPRISTAANMAALCTVPFSSGISGSVSASSWYRRYAKGTTTNQATMARVQRRCPPAQAVATATDSGTAG